jgi:hypothetical protein
VTSFYLPGNLSSITDHETRPLDDVIPADTTRIDDITSRLATQRQTLDLDSLLIMHQCSSQKEQRTHWLIVITTIILAILCYLLYSSTHKLRCYYVVAAPSSSTSPPTHTLTAECTQRDTDEENSTTAEQRVTYSSYPTRPATRCSLETH